MPRAYFKMFTPAQLHTVGVQGLAWTSWPMKDGTLLQCQQSKNKPGHHLKCWRGQQPVSQAIFDLQRLKCKVLQGGITTETIEKGMQRGKPGGLTNGAADVSACAEPAGC